ncbi:MAG: rhodanese-like domain-containing protein [Thermodesulfobacteriota bacterium]|nr:rhodanese-like domain-containing protein [Thermodesulfobacteriota bacterium]
MPYKDIAKELIIILSVTVIAAFTVNYFSPNGIALFGQWDTSQGVITAKPKNDPVSGDFLQINDANTAKKIYDAGKAVFVDARSFEVFINGHIKNAVSIPANQFFEFIDHFKTKYPSTTPVIVYCSGRECNDSHELAQYLMEEGYENVNVFIDGYQEWKKRGYPVEP